MLGILEKFAVKICQANYVVMIRKTLEILMLLLMSFVDVAVASVDVVGVNVGVFVKELRARQPLLEPPPQLENFCCAKKDARISLIRYLLYAPFPPCKILGSLLTGRIP